MVLFVFMKSGTFSMKSGTLFMKSTEKYVKTTKTADSKQISHFYLVFHRVQTEGQLGISYFCGIGGACMCKWYMYTHILTWFCWFS